MLIYTELLLEIKRLTLEDRLALLEALSHSLREELVTNSALKPSPAALVRKMAKPEGPLPTDEEIREDYTSYLAEKHS